MLHVACPSCGASYHVPDAKLGKHATCVKCGTRFVLAAPAPSPPAQNAEFEFDDLARGTAQPHASPHVVASAAPASEPAAPAASTPTWGAASVGAAASSLIAAIPRYLQDVVGTMALMFTPTGLIITVMLCCLQALKLLAPYALCFGILMILIINGYVLSYYLHVVSSGTARDDTLPSLSLTDGIVEDILMPLLKFLAVFVITLLPFVASLIWQVVNERVDNELAGLLLAGVLSFDFSSFLSLTPLQALLLIPPLLLGQVLQPMFLLVVAVGGIRCLWRTDLMLRTVFGTLPAYMVLLVLFWGLNWAASLADSVLAAISKSDMEGVPVTVIAIVRVVIETVVSVFTMRAIGLFYHHFKARFAWSWG